MKGLIDHSGSTDRGPTSKHVSSPDLPKPKAVLTQHSRVPFTVRDFASWLPSTRTGFIASPSARSTTIRFVPSAGSVNL